MRNLSNVVCLVVALGSVALAAWQPTAAPDFAGLPATTVSPAATPASNKAVDERVPSTRNRVLSGGPTVKA